MVLSALCSAQAATSAPTGVDFNGRWILEKVKEHPGSLPFRGGKDPTLEIELVILHLNDRLEIAETFRGSNPNFRKRVIYLDGRSETSSIDTKKTVYKTKAELKKRKIKSKGWIYFTVSGTKNSHYREEEWELSEDAKTLTYRNKTSHNIDLGGGSLISMPQKEGYDLIFKPVT